MELESGFAPTYETKLCPNLSKQKIHLYQANIDFDTRDSESFLVFFLPNKEEPFSTQLSDKKLRDVLQERRGATF